MTSLPLSTLAAVRSYLAAARAQAVDIPTAVAEALEADIVAARKEQPELMPSTLHTWLSVCVQPTNCTVSVRFAV